ncbi:MULTISPECIES: helix-turn-helix domain-containing protein [Cytobacillus]
MVTVLQKAFMTRKLSMSGVTAAAKFLGIPRSSFYKRLKKFGM